MRSGSLKTLPLKDAHCFPSHKGLNMSQNGYTITVVRGRIHDELYNTRDRCGKAGVSTP